MYTYLLSAGSNLGNKISNLEQALHFLAKPPFQILKISSFHTSAAWGYESGNDFLNCCVMLETELEPMDVLARIKGYEKNAGRVKQESTGYTDRIIDLDILFCGQLILSNKSHTIPHPLLHERRFVLVPLNEICPDFVHPAKKQTISDLLEICKDPSIIFKTEKHE